MNVLNAASRLLPHLRFQRHELLADALGQGPEQFADLFLAQSGDHPLQFRRGEALCQREWHADRHAVLFLAGLVGVGERQDAGADGDLIRERRVVVDEVLRVH